ncbi:LacI family DNA-binding transcriptional regulator [Bifidobacterium eulemuris]|uniref:LacI family DNA-binding transcriptional regulator n=1 Tax=Bifidobacterium eulemuris TaxID=1765219 RepID=A0A261GAW4_9BIFI|nr:LacI family DNA-binding transcriptional regulator [Bifidobacterium eulemuris]OZG68559.1 LacI family transcriptional regulator [Bifidobacterium eulemuris]QOL32689.1 LacI family DNA-binding transcriptional regulator [Bifidobacterium eulemuris]
MSSKPTIADVAREAGVTKGTVSHVFNGHRTISAATAKKVTDAAAKLGWIPNQAARALVEKKTNAVGIVLARDPEVLYADAFFPVFLSGLELELSKREIALVLQTVTDREAEERAYRSMSQGRVDGFVVLDMRCDDWRVGLLRELHMKAVLMESGDDYQFEDFSTVWVDDRGPMQEVVDHLHELGHTRIAHVSGPLEYVHSQQRAQGYVERVGSRELLYEGDFTAKQGVELTRELLALSEPPTAIIYANDVMAIGGLSYAGSQGLAIPEDLAIVGYEDDPISVHLNPPMTSVSTNAYNRGQLAAQRLLADIDGDMPKAVQSLPETIRWRASTEGSHLA